MKRLIKSDEEMKKDISVLKDKVILLQAQIEELEKQLQLH